MVLLVIIGDKKLGGVSMSMQIQKGLVKYKDRSDIICTYGITEDGGQYYFLDGNRLSNGNIIATTALVEAIDPVAVSSSIGVIDTNGKVIIPFENKAIKVIADGILLVEKAKPTTESVLEAIKLRSDPLAATKLVTTPATIKDRINEKMGSEGKFVFNDQFSEATIFDINGNNLIDNEYFSFIGVNKEKVFFSKNTVDSDIREYGFNASSNENKAVEDSMDAVKLNIENTGVSKETIEDAINSQVPEKNDNEIKNDEHVNNESVEQVNEQPADNISLDLDSSKSEDTNIEESMIDKDTIDNSDFVSKDVLTEDESSTKEQDVASDSLEDSSVGDISTDQELKDVSSDLKFDITQDMEEDVDQVSVDNNIMDENNSNINSGFLSSDSQLSDVDEANINLFDSMNLSDISKDDSDDSFDSMLQEDSIFSDSDYIDDYKAGYNSVSSNPVKDTIIEDVAVTMSNLIKLNRNQKKKIEKYEMHIDQLKATNKKVVQGAKNQVREIESLKSRVKNYETIVAKLEARNQILDSKVHEQERVIAVQNDELNTLRPQVEGKKDLVRLLEDAQSLFITSGKDNNYDREMVA